METTTPKNKKVLVVLSLILLVVVIFIVGFWAGNQIGMRTGTAEGVQTAEAQYKPLLNVAFPEPPAVLTQTRAKITGIEGSNLTISMDDPNDYLPHLDGSPKKQVARTVVINPNTQIIKLDYSKMNSSGMPLQSSLNLSDLKTGDIIVVTTNSNIRTDNAFVANQITLAVY